MAAGPDSTKLKAQSWSWADRYILWRARRAAPACGFSTQPEPKSIGLVARGRQLASGTYLLGGALVEAKGESLWQVTPPSDEFATAAHSFSWLEDLSAAGDAAASRCAQDWLFEWIALYGDGLAAGWAPDLIGRRVIRWINHAEMVLAGRSEDDKATFFAALTRQLHYLARRWRKAAQGLPRSEALAGLILGSLSLEGQAALAEPALQALAETVSQLIGPDGAIPSRNPEELLEIFTLLIWVDQALKDLQRPVPVAITSAIARIPPTLRALRHADGGLARFHGGGQGLAGRLDYALAYSGVKPAPKNGLAMGYARLAAGRSTLIVDVTAPPEGTAALGAHASSAAFELTSGRRPLIVSCGSGRPFGLDWERAGRATASHSALDLEGYSSSRLGRGEMLSTRAQVREPLLTRSDQGHAVLCGHSGWADSHGLHHLRRLELSADGRMLRGLDRLGTGTLDEREKFNAVLAGSEGEGIAFSVRFHLHPEVDAELDLGGTAVSLGLRSGEIWILRHDGRAELSITPSIYLEKGRLRPRASKQVTLSARVVDYAAELGWTLAKAQDTPLAIRDLERDDPPV